MEYRELGKTGLSVSVFGIGTWQLSGPLTLNGKPDGFPDPGEAFVLDLISNARELGINFIDTAPMYGDGEGERRVGKAIRNQRAHWVLSTKFGMRASPDGQRLIDTSPSAIRKNLEESLFRLGTDYVDVYFYHSPPQFEELEKAKIVLEQLKQEGKIRSFGISTQSYDILQKMEPALCPEVVMFSQSLIRTPITMLHFLEKHDCGAIIRGVFEGGRLTSAYFNKPAVFPNDDIRSHTLAHEDFRKYAAFNSFIPDGADMIHLALRYVLDFKTTHSIVLGTNTIEGYRNAIKTLEFPSLQNDQLKAIKRVAQPLSLQKPSTGWRVWRRLDNMLK